MFCFVFIFSVYNKRMWQSHNLELTSDQHVQNVRDIHLCCMCSSSLERQLSGALLSASSAAGGRLGLDPKCRVTTVHMVTSLSPGSSARGYWNKRILLLCPVVVPVSCSTVGMKTAQQTEQAG